MATAGSENFFRAHHERRAGCAERVPPHHDPACWGCGDNPNGIHLPAARARRARRTYEASFRFDERHQGGPGLVHGGLVSAALDEACGLLATWHRFPSVTARIFVRYRRPVQINRELVARALGRPARTTRRIHVDGELRERRRDARGGARRVPPRPARALPADAGGSRRRRGLAGAARVASERGALRPDRARRRVGGARRRRQGREGIRRERSRSSRARAGAGRARTSRASRRRRTSSPPSCTATCVSPGRSSASTGPATDRTSRRFTPGRSRCASLRRSGSRTSSRDGFDTVQRRGHVRRPADRSRRTVAS